MKKALSLFLVLVMLCGMMPMTVFSAEETDAAGIQNPFEGKKVSIISASTSTYAGVSNNTEANSTIGKNDVYYTEGRHGVYQKDMWWQQVIDVLDMELLVNNAWSGSCIFQPRKGAASVGYGDRAVNLHNDHTGEEPDIVWVYLGSNDFAYYQDTFGKAVDVDYSAMIKDNGDGTFDYTVPTTTCEAYAIMLHKIENRYPGIEIYCMPALARRDPDYAEDNRPDPGQPTAFNAELIAVAEHFGCTVINWENCIPKEAELFDQYIGDKRAHPNAAGMDLMSQAVISGMLGKETELYDISGTYTNVHTNNNAAAAMEGGDYHAKLTADRGSTLDVTVTMGGMDATQSVYSNGTIHIEKVTGDIKIIASAYRAPQEFRWEVVDGTLASTGKNKNTLTALAESISDGVIREGRYQLETPVILKHDRPWVMEWKCAGDWRGILLSTTPSSGTDGRQYLARTKGGQLCFGIRNGSQSNNYGVDLSKLDAQPHTYRLENRIAADGSNMVWLYLDGIEVGLMNNYFLASKDQGATSDWINGKDFVFPYIGMDTTPVTNCQLDYLSVTECDHTYENGVCTGCGAKIPNSISLRYDDHYDVSGKTVEIVDAGKPTSYQVGYGVAENAVRDTAVVTLRGDTLIATGIGSATVKIDGVLHEVTVTAAPISLLLLIGQSNMQGSEGDENQSIVCPDGMVYSTYGDRYTMTTSNATNFAPSALTGAGSALNVNGTVTNLADWPVYLLNEAGVGKKGPDSGCAYEWVKQTGEKVWVVNAAHGGSAISTWQDGGANYEECVKLFKACQETLRKEIDAGHFTLSHMGYFWCQGCTDYDKTAEWYVNKYLTMHNNLKTELAFDENTTFEFAGIIPVRAGNEGYISYRQGVYADTTSRKYYESFKDLRFTGPRVAQYWMTNNPELPDIWNVCNIGEDWVWMPDGTNGVTEYFQSHYENGTVDYPTQVKQSASWYTPTTPKAVHDSIHYNQIGYNEVGREAARNALIMLGKIVAPDVEITVELLSWDGYTPMEQVTASTAGNSGTLVVPKVYPVWKSKDVTYQLSEGLRYEYYDLLAESPLMNGTLRVVGTDVAVSLVGRELTSYAWELENGTLVSTGDTENTISKVSGSTENGVFIDAQYRFEKSITLLHDQNWVLEWKMTGPWYDAESTASKKLFCEDGASSTPNAMCLLIKGNENRITIGYYNGSTTHISYGLDLDDYDISMTDTHIYRLVNHINDDGTNTICLFVDGKQIGPMTRYFTGTSGYMGETSDWLSGRDISFSYMGAPKYLLDNGVIEYISVMECGAEFDVHFHDWSDWHTVTTPSPNGPGEETRTCSGCGQTETKIVESIWQTTNILDHWSELPEDLCSNVNLWSALEHDTTYYVNSKGDWGYHSSRDVPSVTIPVNPGDRIYATSFEAAFRNGHGSSNGIRVTWFSVNGVLKTTDPVGTYAEFTANGGYLVAPEGAVAINIPMWGDKDSYEIYILNREHTYTATVTAPTCNEQGYTIYTCSCGENYVDDYVDAMGHTYENGICTGCGAEHPNLANYKGKVISILGDSISTFAGYIPVADGFNLEHLARYPQDNLLTDVNETWWMQVIAGLDAKLGINDSWRGATVSGAKPVTTGTTGENAAMANLTRLQNLGANGTPDVILFYGGTNDLAHVSSVGSFDPDTAPSAVDLTTKKWDNLADAYVHTLLRLRYYYPDTTVIAMLPTYTKSYYSADKLAQANAILAQICDHYDITYVDLRYCGISPGDLPDGIHPDANGMDYISAAVLETLLDESEMEAGENIVHTVTHNLTGAESTMGYYKGVTHGKSFVTTITGENVTVSVTMGGVNITDIAYANGVVSVAAVTGDLVITAQGSVKPIYADHLQQLPENVCSGTNLWAALEHDSQYYTVNGWGTHSSGTVYSVTFPVSAGDRIYATSFGAAGNNGSGTNGIRVTWFDNSGLLKTVSADKVYAEFSASGYLAVPEGATVVSIPMWNVSDANEIYILNRDHIYIDGKCRCGAVMEVISNRVPYRMDGQTITITYDKACRVGYWDEDAQIYIALPAVEVGEESLSFEIPRDATRILIVIKGDTNSNGSVTSADIARLNAYLKNKVDLTSEVLFAADVNSDGNVNEADIQYLSDAILGKSNLPG